MRYEVATELTIAEALEQATVFFGPHGVGLQLMSQTEMSLVFQGGGGHVTIAAKSGTAGTVLELETREWDYPVQRFMARVSKRRCWWTHWWRRKKPTIPPPQTFTILNKPPDHRPTGR